MHVAKVEIKHFRGIESAELRLGPTALLLGDNNSGKSSALEAIELALGPDRLYRRPPIDEHDFHGGAYLDQKIWIEVTVAGLDDALKSKFRAHLEYWDPAEFTILETTPPGDPEQCVRIQFIGRYDADEDDFVGETWFSHPLKEDGELAHRCSSTDKREFGFILLRALRTGNRAMSMERGSLLDSVLRAFEVEVQMWEKLLERLRDIPVTGDDDDEFGKVLTSLDQAMKKIVPAEWGAAPHLRVSELTREDLRHVLRSFMATGADGYSAPFNHQGSGTVNSLVIAMLSLIAEKRQNRVIFAMEEPEISLPPTAQKRIVDLIRGLAGQTLFTSHSPYVLEEFEPEEMVVVSRDHRSGVLSGATVSLPRALRHKVFMRGMRTRFSEALLARRVLVCEGRSEALAYPHLAKAGNAEDPSLFTRLDTDGWAVFDAEGETNVASFAAFFKGLGKTVATIFDAQDDETLETIRGASDLTLQQPYKGFEEMLLAETPASAKREFVDKLRADGDWPQGAPQPAGDGDEAYEVALKKLLKATKGEGTAMHLLSTLKIDDYPATMRGALDQLRDLVRNDIDEALEADGEEDVEAEEGEGELPSE